jgi:flagellar assembly factor FliW
MKWKNRQFGELEFDDQHVLTFPEGIIGFEDCRRFILVNDEDSQPFRWLVSIEDEDLSLPMLDPQLLVPSYEASHAQRDGATTLVVATLSEEIEDSTVNMRSPVIIMNGSRTGKQIILEDEAHALQHPLFLAPQQPVKG